MGKWGVRRKKSENKDVIVPNASVKTHHPIHFPHIHAGNYRFFRNYSSSKKNLKFQLSSKEVPNEFETKNLNTKSSLSTGGRPTTTPLTMKSQPNSQPPLPPLLLQNNQHNVEMPNLSHMNKYFGKIQHEPSQQEQQQPQPQQHQTNEKRISYKNFFKNIQKPMTSINMQSTPPYFLPLHRHSNKLKETSSKSCEPMHSIQAILENLPKTNGNNISLPPVISKFHGHSMNLTTNVTNRHATKDNCLPKKQTSGTLLVPNVPKPFHIQQIPPFNGKNKKKLIINGRNNKRNSSNSEPLSPLDLVKSLKELSMNSSNQSLSVGSRLSNISLSSSIVNEDGTIKVKQYVVRGKLRGIPNDIQKESSKYMETEALCQSSNNNNSKNFLLRNKSKKINLLHKVVQLFQ
ncbi:hypothetical protein SNEBB_003249 [Seison nebaliae]|nr:hypothetical protein SNEBB_003249 [Seison nebaliae]